MKLSANIWTIKPFSLRFVNQYRKLCFVIVFFSLLLIFVIFFFFLEYFVCQEFKLVENLVCDFGSVLSSSPTFFLISICSSSSHFYSIRVFVCRFSTDFFIFCDVITGEFCSSFPVFVCIFLYFSGLGAHGEKKSGIKKQIK